MNRKIKKQTVSVKTEEGKEIIRFVKVLTIVLVCVLGIYLFTRAFVTKDLFNNEKKEETTEPVSISYDVTTLGSLFTRPYKDYYVLVYNSKDKLADYYATVASKYKEDEDSIKIYTADLNTAFNQSFYSETTSTPNATSTSELKVKGATLIKISNGKIVKFLEDKETITTELNTEKE